LQAVQGHSDVARPGDFWRFPWLLMAAALALTGLGVAGIYAAIDPAISGDFRGC